MGEWRLGRHRGKFCAVRNTADGRRVRTSLKTDDRERAGQLIEQMNADLRKPVAARTVAALWEAYIAEMEGRAIAETMQHTGKAILPRFGAMPPEGITVDQFRAYTADRRARVIKDGSIHTELGHLRMALCWAVRRRIIAEAPHIERPPKPAPVDRHLTRDEVRRMRDAASMPHVRLGITLLIGTGARIEALSELTWDRVDVDRDMIHLRDPGDGRRRKGRASVPMNRPLKVALLEAQCAAQTDSVLEWAGKPVRSLKRSLRTAATKAGVGKVSHHLFRHLAAVWLAEAGKSMDEIAQFLGHSDVSVTLRVYARFSPTYLRGSADVLSL